MNESVRIRPQPVGVFPFPVGMLLLPDAPDNDALTRLMAGETPAELPREWAFYGLALQGRFEEAADLLKTADDPIARYNRFVLTGDSIPDFAAPQDKTLAMLARVAAYGHGLVDDLPSEREIGSLDGELLAVTRMMQAARHLEQQENESARLLLLDAAASVRTLSPIFAAQLYVQAAQGVEAREALAIYRTVTELLEQGGNHRLAAEVWIARGQACQEISSALAVPNRSLLMEAADAYQRAIARGLSVEHNPDLFALAQNNLGLVYLAMPMDGDGARLRVAVAVQSFREALKVYDPEHTPEQWVSTQLNLANALQYAHSAHPEENIARAVEIYEDLLEKRPRGLDPIGHARLLANQANALAHLGIFAPALTKATEAHKLLHWHGEPEMAQMMLQLTETINEKLAAQGTPVEVAR